MRLFLAALVAVVALMMTLSEAAKPPRRTQNTRLEMALRSKIRVSKDLVCEPIRDQSTCDQTDACVWCKAGAIPSACFTVEDAKKLPPAVFKCDLPPSSDAKSTSLKDDSDSDSDDDDEEPEKKDEAESQSEDEDEENSDAEDEAQGATSDSDSEVALDSDDESEKKGDKSGSEDSDSEAESKSESEASGKSDSENSDGSDSEDEDRRRHRAWHWKKLMSAGMRRA